MESGDLGFFIVSNLWYIKFRGIRISSTYFYFIAHCHIYFIDIVQVSNLSIQSNKTLVKIAFKLIFKRNIWRHLNIFLNKLFLFLLARPLQYVFLFPLIPWIGQGGISILLVTLLYETFIVPIKSANESIQTTDL